MERWIRAEAARGAAGERESGAAGEGAGARVWGVDERERMGAVVGVGITSTQYGPNLGGPKFAGLFSSRRPKHCAILDSSPEFGRTKRSQNRNSERQHCFPFHETDRQRKRARKEASQPTRSQSHASRASRAGRPPTARWRVRRSGGPRDSSLSISSPHGTGWFQSHPHGHIVARSSALTNSDPTKPSLTQTARLPPPPFAPTAVIRARIAAARVTRCFEEGFGGLSPGRFVRASRGGKDEREEAKAGKGQDGRGMLLHLQGQRARPPRM